ncbi:LOW QUALITY PROTEIN: thioredoxin-like protein 4A [Alca torda]
MFPLSCFTREKEAQGRPVAAGAPQGSGVAAALRHGRPQPLKAGLGLRGGGGWQRRVEAGTVSSRVVCVVPQARHSPFRMSYLPHLHNGWQVDQAILLGEDRVVVIRFADWDPTCMKMDEVYTALLEGGWSCDARWLLSVVGVSNGIYEA